MKNVDEAIKAVQSLNGASSPELGGMTLDVHFASPTEKKCAVQSVLMQMQFGEICQSLYVFAVNARSAYADMARKRRRVEIYAFVLRLCNE